MIYLRAATTFCVRFGEGRLLGPVSFFGSALAGRAAKSFLSTPSLSFSHRAILGASSFWHLELT
jgi:hypothetical protein